MKAIVSALVFAVAVMVGADASQSLTYEAFILGGAAGRHLLVNGVRTYAPGRDIVVQESKGGGKVFWTKSLLLDGDFAISASVYREPTLTGFGLVVQRVGDAWGFSWEWFQLAEGNVFRKLQGSGQLAVTLTKGAGYVEINAIEFLDDIVLRYTDDMSKPPGTHTHELVVRKGSVLKLAP